MKPRLPNPLKREVREDPKYKPRVVPVKTRYTRKRKHPNVDTLK